MSLRIGIRLYVFVVACLVCASVSGGSRETNKLIVYLSREAAEKVVFDGFENEKPLGGESYRKSFDQLNLPIHEAEGFRILSVLLGDYPYAVVTRGQLYFETDDNCSGVGESFQGVDISEACQNHDYCIRKLSGARTLEEDRDYFRRCNYKFTIDIKKACNDSGKKCSRSPLYQIVLDRTFYYAYRRRQSREAHMIKKLIRRLSQSEVDLAIVRGSNLIGYRDVVNRYGAFCNRVSNMKLSNSYLLPSEVSACN
jgi:hypothetical protein